MGHGHSSPSKSHLQQPAFNLLFLSLPAWKTAHVPSVSGEQLYPVHKACGERPCLCPEDDKNAAPCSKWGGKGIFFFFFPRDFSKVTFRAVFHLWKVICISTPRTVNAAGCRANHSSSPSPSYIAPTQEGVNCLYFHPARWVKRRCCFPWMWLHHEASQKEKTGK